MRIRTPGLLVVIASLLLGAVGSLVAVAATPGSAQACSIAGPYAEVWPTSALQPGQQFDVIGWSFIDVQVREPQPALVAPPDSDRAVPPELCDFDTFPLESLRVVWHGPATNGEVTETLAVVAGPDFMLVATVPQNAASGPAAIIIGPVTVNVQVGSVVEPPPPPCPLVTDATGVVSHSCPEPWPCPLTTQPAPDHTPGLFPPCPEPCVDYAHTIDDGTEYHYQWDCPDPCGYEESPGAAPGEAAMWCPPPPPDPCPVYNAAAPAGASEAIPWCPDPCEVVGGDAVWCPPPPPDPCPLYTAAVPDGGNQAIPWCPDPCPVYFGADGDVASERLIACPDPCEVVGGDAVWCPPPCFDGTAAIAIDCPTPVPVPAHDVADADLSTTSASVVPLSPVAVLVPAATDMPPQPVIAFDEFVTGSDPTPAMSDDAVAASTAAAAVARDIMAIARGMLAYLFG